MPMPPVSGGAVETLTENYLQYNEKHKQLSYVVYSYGQVNQKGYEKSLTEYRFVKKNNLFDLLFKIIRKLTKEKTPDYFLYKIRKDTKKRNEIYDCAVIENRPVYALYTKKRICNQVILHAHNEWFGNNASKICNSCNQVIVVSDYMRKKLMQQCGAKNIKVIFNAIDEKKFNNKTTKEQLEKAKNKYRIKDDDFVILFTGKLKQEKGALELIKAFNIANKQVDNLVLLMAGAISGKKSYKEAIKEESSTNKNIHILGYIDYKELPLLYKLSNLQVIPSQWNDPCPLTVFEGISAHLPQIVTDSGGIPEITKNAGVVVLERGINFVNDLSVAILSIVNNPKKLKELSNKQKLKKYRIDTFCEEMAKSITDTCEEISQ